jgi:hypothetical protein
MKASFNQRFSGCDVAGHAFADFSFGPQSDQRGFRFMPVTLFDWRLQRF